MAEPDTDRHGQTKGVRLVEKDIDVIIAAHVLGIPGANRVGARGSELLQ